MLLDRYEKEFDGVQDVFELQVRSSAGNTGASCKNNSRIYNCAEKSKQRIRIRSRSLTRCHRSCSQSGTTSQRLPNRSQDI